MQKLRYVIGDVHGCYYELLELEAMLQKDAENHAAAALQIFVGDLVDRGEMSKEVLAHIRSSPHSTAVLGNHDDMFMQAYVASTGQALPGISSQFLSNPQQVQELWYFQGGKETLDSYGCTLESMVGIPTADMHFLARLPLLWYDNDVLVSHALADKKSVDEALHAPMHRPEKQKSRISLLWERRTPEKRLDPDRLHISGHTPLQEVYIDREKGYIQIDTGCVYGNKLSAFCVENSRVFSVPRRKAKYR